MMAYLQPIILWAALPLAFLLVVATIDALATVIKSSEQRMDPNKYASTELESDTGACRQA